MRNHQKPNIIIINADDFGLSDETNETVLASFEQSLVTSATLMANMPAFQSACQQAQEHHFAQHLGLHFNLTYGKPLTHDIRLVKNICNSQGEFEFGLPRHTLYLPKTTKQAIYQELKQQWQACLDNGIQPSHIDSHQHVHNLLPIANIVASFAKQKGVPVRLARNTGKNIGMAKAAFKSIVNARITRLSKTAVRYACTPIDLINGFKPEGIVEIICHPKRLADGRIGDDYLPANTALKDVIEAAYPNAKHISYDFFKK